MPRSIYEYIYVTPLWQDACTCHVTTLPHRFGDSTHSHSSWSRLGCNASLQRTCRRHVLFKGRLTWQQLIDDADVGGSRSSGTKALPPSSSRPQHDIIPLLHHTMRPLQQGTACGNHPSASLEPVRGLVLPASPAPTLPDAHPRTTSPHRERNPPSASVAASTSTSPPISRPRRCIQTRARRMACTTSCRATRARRTRCGARAGRRRQSWALRAT